MNKLYVTTAFALRFAYILTLLPISHVEAADGLVAAYNFDEGTGSSTNDASGNTNTGTILNALWRSSGKNGKAILFNGTSSRIDVNDSNSLDLTTNMTLEAWVKPTTLPTGFRTILHKERANGDSYALYANHDINRPSGEIRTASGYAEVTGTAKVPVTTWTHLATTYDGKKLRLYVNGVLKETTNKTGAIVPSSKPLRIGSSVVWGEFYNGLIDDIRIYNRTLSQAEIQTDMNTPVADNSADPAIVGQWSAPVDTPGLVAQHVNMLSTGKVLIWDGALPGGAGGLAATILDPVTGALTSVPNNNTNLDCAGHAQLADGRILAIGGVKREGGLGVKDANIFNPEDNSWSIGADMNHNRWYPTATTLANGKVLVLSGSDGCAAESCRIGIPELYDPAADTWTQLTSAFLNIPLYPLSFLLPDGKLFVAGTYEEPNPSYTLDVATQTWQTIDSRKLDGASAVLYDKGKIMKAGKAIAPFVSNKPSSAATYVIDMNGPSPQWRETASMNFPRSYHVLTLLPDGSTIVTGGGRTQKYDDTAQAVKEAEIWDPTAEKWTPMAKMTTSRLYHGTALLLPDGRVLVAGSGRLDPAPNQENYEIFSPPYLFKGARPTVTSAPGTVQPGNQIFVGTPDAATIETVSLVRVGAMTHSFNADQRYLSLPFTQTTGGLNAQAPDNVNEIPPGYYVLFVVNANGVPSIANFINVPQAADVPVLPSSALLGNESVESQDNTNAGGSPEAFPFIAAKSGITNTMRIFVSNTNTATEIHVGLYNTSGSNPGSLMTSAVINNPVNNAWNTVALPPVSVAAGTKCWIAFMHPPQSGTIQIKVKATSSGDGSQGSSVSNLTTLPATWAPGPNFPTSRSSTYVLE